VAFVGQQREGQLELLLEFLVRFHRIGTHTENNRTEIPEPVKSVAKNARFLDSAGGVVLGIEVQNDFLTAKILE
jgi:hypothetical protein